MNGAGAGPGRREDAVGVPDGVSPEVPNVARIYDWALGGAHHFAADRQRGAEIAAAYPQGVAATWANRRFLAHAVERMLDHGIDQFLDLGSGIPTVGNVHEIALRRRSDARVAYVDHEPVAVAHSSLILRDVPGATITHADLRDAELVLAAPGVAEHLDLARPVGLLAVAVLHFLGDDDQPGTIMGRYGSALAPGSMLALSHTSGDYPEHPDFDEQRREVLRLYSSTSNPLHERSRAEIAAIVEDAGFVIDADGLVEVDRWAPAGVGAEPGQPLGMYCVVTDPLTGRP